MRIWLDKIHVPKKNRPEGWKRPLGRHVKCKIAKLIYGVDPRDTYDLDFTWRLWLYEHLKMFLKQADPVIDMSEKNIEWDGGKYSLLEMIHMMLDRLEFALDPRNQYDDLDEKEHKYVNQIEQIWATVCPAMWW